MTIRQDDDRDWALVRPARPAAALARRAEFYAASPSAQDTLFELAMVIAGFAGIILVIEAILGASG